MYCYVFFWRILMYSYVLLCIPLPECVLMYSCVFLCILQTRTRKPHQIFKCIFICKLLFSSSHSSNGSSSTRTSGSSSSSSDTAKVLASRAVEAAAEETAVADNATYEYIKRI